MATREERLAANEARFREMNENAQPRREESDEGSRHICECANSGCVAWISVPPADYARVRETPRQFLVKPGHEKPDIEDVVERQGGWFVVAKPDEVAHIVDPDG